MQRQTLRAALFAIALCPLFSTAALAGDAVHGAQVFKRCSACHAADTPTNKVGPTLKGVFGRQAGAVETYRYSPAMQDAGKAGLTWDDAALSDYIASPRKKVPGTRMGFGGMTSQTDIDDVIEYLKQNP